MLFASESVRRRPAPAQLEVSVFGPGVGECIVVHLGADRWMVVDSCLHKGQPVALGYLEALGVPLEHVCAVVSTHWHDDHHRGLFALLQVCPAAQFFCSSALDCDQIKLLIGMEDLAPGTGGVKELGNILRLLKARRTSEPMAGPRWLGPGQVVFCRPSQACIPEVRVLSLSPSSDEQTAAMLSLNNLIAGYLSPKRQAVATSPNHAAVVLQVTVGQQSALLGADLQEHGVASRGWSAVVANHVNVGDKSQVYKVAHHGSANGHHCGVYSQLLHPKSDLHSVLTPFRRSHLPKPTDVQRLSAFAAAVHLTAPAQVGQPDRRSGAVEREMRAVARERQLELGPMGIVRIRWGGGGPEVEYFGAAYQAA